MFSKRLKKLREDHQLSQQMLADELGVAQSTIGMWECGKREPDFQMTKRIASFFRVTADELIGGLEEMLEIPVLGRIPAGIPFEAVEEILDWEDIPSRWTRGDKSYFALKIKGDSMYPKYLDGDTIIVRRQQTAETGQDAVVMVNDNDATFKKVIIDQKGIMLRPINPEYEIRFFSRQEAVENNVQILGVCCEIRRKP